jgi:hypothetical protein
MGKEINYLYFQEFIPNNDSDTRIIVIDGKAFGIKRMNRKNDFRASGSGFILYEKEHIDIILVKTAFDIHKKLNAQCIAYDFVYDDEPCTVDLSTIENKPFDESLIKKGTNEFSYTLPNSGNLITFKILTAGDDKKIDAELAGLKKINKDSSPELSTRLKYLITSVNGDREAKTIREFVDNHLLARDSRLLREYIRKVQPDVDLTFISNSGEEVAIPVNLSFFWPDA